VLEEEQWANALAEAAAYNNILSDARQEASYSLGELLPERDNCEETEEQAERSKAEHEQETSRAKIELQRAETEARKAAEKRRRDVREEKMHWQTMLARSEEFSRRAAQQLEDDRAKVQDRLRQSEARNRRLESEVQQFTEMQVAGPDTADAATLEAAVAAMASDNQRFLGRCADAEEQLRLCEAAEDRRQRAIAQARADQAELLQRLEALKHEHAFRAGYARAARAM
jgi:hypothetical protein